MLASSRRPEAKRVEPRQVVSTQAQELRTAKEILAESFRSGRARWRR